MDELNKAHEAILQDKFYHLGRLTAVAQKLIASNYVKQAKVIKEAIDFFEYNMK